MNLQPIVSMIIRLNISIHLYYQCIKDIFMYYEENNNKTIITHSLEYMNDESLYSIHLFLSIDSFVALNN